MGWTPDQEKAIKAPAGNGNILVSAAAGSGKTAVLVERILQKIIKNETSVDRLLVVTFTEAAAAEMREKIIKRLIKEMEEAPHTRGELKKLKDQVHLAESADIMTIDAFCNRVVMNNFHVLGTDPNISIADSAMCSLLREEATETLFDRLYKTEYPTEQERFSRLIDAYASNRDDNGLAAMIYYVYSFVMSFADPEKWLDEKAAVYSIQVSRMPHAQYMENISRNAAKSCIVSLDTFLETVRSDTLRAYAEEMRTHANAIYTATEWDEIFGIYKAHFKKKRANAKATSLMQTLPKAECEEFNDDADRLNYIRSVLLDSLNRGITVSEDELESQCNSAMLKEQADDLVWIVKEFMKEYSAAKDKQGVREFADIEHLTYTLFRDHKDIRKIYTDKYDEILIDEYQDTNGLQDAIFTMISHNNIFMVGDLKQSIYRFRGGDPYIFKAKSEAYELPDVHAEKITLSQNFRSRMEILNSVNDIFTCIMSRHAGDVEYYGSEMIVREKSRDYYPPALDDCTSELHYLMVEDCDKSLAEIQFTADKIKEILTSGVMVYDKDDEKLRPIRSRDIVILENSVKSNGALLVSELEKRGIDAFTETESFFNRREICIMMSLLSVINNVRQDIPLLSVMRSPIGGFTENDLTRIRLAYGMQDNFISAVRFYAFEKQILPLKNKAYSFVSGNLRYTDGTKRKNRLKAKCASFIYNLRRWRDYVRTKSVAQLIWTIYEETYFYDMMGAIEGGEEAQFNLRLLYERARQYENAGFKGLFNFARYIEQLESRDEDLGGAKLIGENHDVVRIMTIHKSKGLEFPYVFVLGCGKRFNRKGGISTIPLHKELGFGMPYIFYDKHYMQDTKIKDLITAVNKEEMTSEQMRLLYVALTRACEKLFVVVSAGIKAEDTEESLNKGWKKSLLCGRMLPSTALDASGFFDWICPAAYASPNTWKFIYHHINSIDESAAEEEPPQKTYEDSAELKAAVYAILDYTYPYSESHLIPSRTSVTQLKELTIERMTEKDNVYDNPVYEPDSRRRSGTDDMAELMFSPLHTKPTFMLEEGTKPANEIGTLYHLVMSEVNLSRIIAEGTECLDDEISRMVQKSLINKEDLRYIDLNKIKAFFDSSIGKRMLKSGEIHREAPFQINIPAQQYDPALSKKYNSETVILQGIIDCFFKENDSFILVDYKTDKVRGNAGAIRKKYAKQLELYAQAIEKLTGTRVTQSYLYLFDSGEFL